jgi:hypothetical protein
MDKVNEVNQIVDGGLRHGSIEIDSLLVDLDLRFLGF